MASRKHFLCAVLDLLTAVPEPASWGMLLAGLALVAGRGRRRAGAA